MSLTDVQVTAIRTTGLTDPELWRPVAGYEGLYEVSSLGQVRSLPHRGGTRLCPGKVIYQCKRRYASVRLSAPGKVKTFAVHQLVARAFVIGMGPIVRHLDDDGLNNVRSNLVWGSYAENSVDMFRNGSGNRGERNGSAVLTESVVRQIRALREEGMLLEQIAESLGQTYYRVKHVLSGEAWSHVS